MKDKDSSEDVIVGPNNETCSLLLSDENFDRLERMIPTVDNEEYSSRYYICLIDVKSGKKWIKKKLKYIVIVNKEATDKDLDKLIHHVSRLEYLYDLDIINVSIAISFNKLELEPPVVLKNSCTDNIGLKILLFNSNIVNLNLEKLLKGKLTVFNTELDLIDTNIYNIDLTVLNNIDTIGSKKYIDINNSYFYNCDHDADVKLELISSSIYSSKLRFRNIDNLEKPITIKNCVYNVNFDFRYNKAVNVNEKVKQIENILKYTNVVNLDLNRDIESPAFGFNYLDNEHSLVIDRLNINTILESVVILWRLDYYVDVDKDERRGVFTPHIFSYNSSTIDARNWPIPLTAFLRILSEYKDTDSKIAYRVLTTYMNECIRQIKKLNIN